mmetsp:Transcript_126582/g.188897  ORF Transcript_126582/g.188897 Transcript_126582/m.188897 type:complete len:183 (-) Transcript_126582:21-569(-)|eukprot:CAMPEP_0116996652 /NCGR_PEP_ID=MMETSP0472-20121206/386_1 /TAXON_ID=693140 ORGANISM="Tiarina fusus, Strain LIS" /NCGR_SAMPLE_ID=MMETSP0472 /ASSEMBLY_ACC=CAM_ASM_000603 /LENGTH=182 /DNA_ID=CAMNT_0004695343 /DNA_START=37 /DNA_END=585 /DNA_ORIENTATION=-
MASPRPDDVLKLEAPTEGFLCPLAANVYGVEFLEFRIRDLDAGMELFSVKKPEDDGTAPPPPLPEDEDAVRTIRYNFGPDFLRRGTIGTSLVFSVGPREVPSFRMVERHYFKDRLLKSFDFTLGFCMPNSRNTWEVIYTLPKLTPEQEQEMIDSPYQSRSDSFYFVGDTLIMHNKAEYSYQG